jgi:hypothetical protein
VFGWARDGGGDPRPKREAMVELEGGTRGTAWVAGVHPTELATALELRVGRGYQLACSAAVHRHCECKAGSSRRCAVRTPCRAADIGGPAMLMRDVKNFICNRLGLGEISGPSALRAPGG